MSDWSAAVDKNTGKTYYYNKKTKETRWTKPEENEDPSKDAPENWAATVDKKTGKTYYYNKVTKETRWTKPAGVADPSASAMTADDDEEEPSVSVSKTVAADEEDLGDPREWRKVVDQRTGRAYYYNKTTKATSWKKPMGFDEAQMARDTPARGAAEEKAAAPAIPIPKAPATINERAFVSAAASKTSGAPVALGGPKKKFDDSDSGGEDPVDDDDDDEEDATEQANGTSGKAAGRKLLDDDPVEDDMSTGGVKFDFAKHRKGWMARAFHVGPTFDEKKLLSFKKTLIKKALLKQNREFDADAVQSFKNIMSYMGDRKSHKEEGGHARKIVANALAAPESLKDEILLQICKQLISRNAIKGWELLSICLSSFPPSRQMKAFVEDFLERNRKDETNDSEARRLANVCMERLEKIAILGPRLEIPSTVEIERDQAGAMVPIRVYTLDGTPRTVDADSFTVCRDVKKQIVQKLGISYSTAFSLYEFSVEGEEKILDEEIRVLDVFSSWERIARERKLSEAEPFRFLYKAELVLKTTEKNLIEDEEAINLMYIQAVHDVVRERYPGDAKDIPSLAALQLQAQQGDYKPETHTMEWITEKLPELVPHSVITGKKGISKKRSSEMSQKIITKYAKLTGVSTQEAKLSYLDYVQEWPLYGAAFITVEQKQLKDYPPFIRLAVTCDACLLVHPETSDVLDQFQFSEIVTWGYSEEKFILVVGNLVQQRKLFFKTNRGKYINKLVNDYVKTKIPASS